MKNVLMVLFSVFVFINCSSKVDYTTLKSGLKYQEIKVPKSMEAATAKAGNLVEVNFKAWVVKDSLNLFTDWSSDSTKKNDLIADSYAMKQPIKFVLGSENFIKGSDEGIIGMKAGGQRAIIIPASLAYGAEGMGPIPPNSSIKVLIELVSVKDVVKVKMWDVDSTLFKTTKSGLKYAIIKEGEGNLIVSGKQANVHYSGYLLDGTLFDSSVERDESITFPVGVGQVIPGWDEGLMLLKKGSKARFIIPPSLAYGTRVAGKIPSNSTLVFDIEVIDVK